MENLEWSARAIVWGSAIYHAFMALPSMFSLELTRKIVGKLYKLELEGGLDPKFEYAVKPLGAFAVFTSMICFWSVAAGDPEFFRFICAALAALFLTRAGLRVVYRDLLFRAFKVKFSRSLANVAFNFVISAILIAYFLVK